MDASSTIEMELNEPLENFYISQTYTFGEISNGLILLTILGVVLWKIIKDEFAKK